MNHNGTAPLNGNGISAAQNGNRERQQGGDGDHTPRATHIIRTEPVETPSGLTLNRAELVRVCVQSLQSLGYRSSAATLEDESGISLEPQFIKQFRSEVRSGNWEEVEKLLPLLEHLTDSNRDKARVLIAEQRFLEFLEKGLVAEALSCLRSITALHTDNKRVQLLSSLVIAQKDELYKEAAWDGAQGKSRELLMGKLEKLMPPSLLVPNNRLLVLLEQAVQFQYGQCSVHDLAQIQSNASREILNEGTSPSSSKGGLNGVVQNSMATSVSLLHDHSCEELPVPQKCIFTSEEHTGDVLYVVFSHDGKRLASASSDGSLIIYDFTGGKLTPLCVLTDSSVSEPSSSSSDSEDNSDDQNREGRRNRNKNSTYDYCAWSPDDSLLVSCGGDDGVVRLWKTSTGTCLLKFQHHTMPVMAVGWSPNGKHIISASVDKSVCVTDLLGKEVQRWRSDVAYDLAVVANPGSAKTSNTQVLVASPGRVACFDLEEKGAVSESHSFAEQRSVTSVTVSRDGSRALVGLSSPPGIRMWNLHQRRKEAVFEGFKQQRFIIRASFGGPSDNYVVSGSEDCQVYVWDRRTAELLAVLPGHSGPVNHVAWCPADSRFFVSASDDKTLRVWSSE